MCMVDYTGDKTVVKRNVYRRRKKKMDKLKRIGNRIFIEGLSGMAQGLFATLIIGTIIQQIGSLVLRGLFVFLQHQFRFLAQYSPLLLCC